MGSGVRFGLFLRGLVLRRAQVANAEEGAERFRVILGKLVRLVGRPVADDRFGKVVDQRQFQHAIGVEVRLFLRDEPRDKRGHQRVVRDGFRLLRRHAPVEPTGARRTFQVGECAKKLEGLGCGRGHVRSWLRRIGSVHSGRSYQRAGRDIPGQHMDNGRGNPARSIVKGPIRACTFP